ncbi:MAG TPA: hypothetical protein VIT41_14465 [Microlunatus sp.]
MSIEPTPSGHNTRTDVDPCLQASVETAPTLPRPPRVVQSLDSIESWIAPALRRISAPLLRGSLALVFVWFGALKVAGVTPVADLVADSVPWLDRAWFIPVLGLVEIVLGAAMMLGRFLAIVSLILVGHLAGTFMVLVMQPELAFQHGNPMLLTTIGEFVIKNLVLASAAIAAAAWSRQVWSSAKPARSA